MLWVHSLVTILFFLLMPFRSSRAASDLFLVGARPAGLAGAFIALADDANSPFLNPAGMPQLKRVELTSDYAVLYGVDGLGQITVSGVAPTPIGAFGLFVHQLGGTLYRESTLGLAYGRTLGPYVAVGALARLQRLSIERYGSVGDLAIDTGVLFHLPQGVRLGIVARNLYPTERSSFAPRSPVILQTGISHTSGRLSVNLQTDYDSRFGFSTAIGQEFRIGGMLMLRAGLRTQPSVASFGLGIALPHIEAACSVTIHPILGRTSRFSLTCRL